MHNRSKFVSRNSIFYSKVRFNLFSHLSSVTPRDDEIVQNKCYNKEGTTLSTNGSLARFESYHE